MTDFSGPESVRAAVERLLGRRLRASDTEENLIGLGLDSMRIMRLAGDWRRSGIDVGFAELAREPTLARWSALLAERGGGAAGAVRQAADRKRGAFPLTPVQRAYWVGRNPAMVLGGVGCHAYYEFDGHGVEADRLRRAVCLLTRRHPMLRARFLDSGEQEILAESPWTGPVVRDLRELDDRAAAERLAAIRDELSHRVLRVGEGEVFDVGLSLLPGNRTRLHFDIDLLVADVRSIGILLKDLARCYAEPGSAEAAEPGYTFAEYLADARERESDARRQAAEYWRGRLELLPRGGPELPLATAPERVERPRFSRRATRLEPAVWARIRDRAAAHALTPAVVLATAYSAVLAEWSGQKPFLLNLPLFDRDPARPAVDGMVADFTSLILLAVEPRPGQSFADRARGLQERLHEDISAGAFSAVGLLAEMNRRFPGERVGAPVVFACNLGEEFVDARFRDQLGEQTWMLSQTPQVWLDHQVYDSAGGLVLAWDAVDELFPDGMLDAMFGAYEQLLDRLADADWAAALPPLAPPTQLAVRALANATEGPLPDSLLHEEVVCRAEADPERIAVISPRRDLSYRELLGRARAVAAGLAECGCGRSELVAIVMDKGWEQVVAVLGVLLAGGAYLPIDTNQPPARRERLLRDASVRLVLTQSWVAESPGTRSLAVDLLGETGQPSWTPAAPGDLAYVIYTSGSTGAPKGVMISHRSARNTIDDVTRRFGVTGRDRVLGLSNLGFDLSVYDLFGPLAVGGTLVLPDPARRTDPSHWAELIARHGVTLWNSVPAQLQMLRHFLGSAPETALPSLRLALLSGDWIPVRLPDEIRALLPGLELVSLGGATEAAIWSIHHPIGETPPDWVSIPYGKPLTNQTFHVLDPAGRPAPDHVPGELYIGGAGVALGYLGDEEKTAERFGTGPGTTERRYRTGDFGRYLPDGTIEFLGRKDAQVKILGHRVELAEIEAALEGHPSVGAAAVITDGERPLDRRLAGFVETARGRRPDEAATGLLTADADAVAATALAGVDRDAAAGFRSLLDRAELTTMAWALRREGLFATAEAAHTTEEILTALGVVPRHHRLLRRWLRALSAEGLLRHGPDDDRYRGLRPVGGDEVEKAWDAAEESCVDAICPAERMRYLRLTASEVPQLLRGDIDHVRSFFPQGGLDTAKATFTGNVVAKYLNTVVHTLVRRLAGQSDRGLSVLEIGAGIGGTSADLIPALAELDVSYLFTDVSQFFLNEARERFAEQRWVRYGLFDMNLGYREQGLRPNSFDVVLCAHVLHNARDVGQVLGRVRELLRPGGWLIFTEATRDHYELMGSMEFLVRVDSPTGEFADLRAESGQLFLTERQWTDQLRRAGGRAWLCLPAEPELSELCGQHVFAAQFKADRQPVDPDELTAHLTEQLPAHMIPARVQVVDALPKTVNGKIDRAELTRWLGQSRPSAPGAEGTEPRDDRERRVAAVWAEVLGLARIGREQSFFELGGDSLLIAQLVGRLRQNLAEAGDFAFEDLLGRLLRAPTVAETAEYLARGRETS
ncbi:amino acid adenylation domain-containing protein [Amycolatopsis sp. NPDC059021]|uniref:non-ribosomal peptide synthetase n=1 Tax=Amycolatopsis sp. NPDC059021 TaxID=3346704 RepID=UPI00366B82CC